MRLRVKPLLVIGTQITLRPENVTETVQLVTENPELIEHHYQRAIRSKFGPTAHLTGFSEINYPTEVKASYILEGSLVRA